MGKIKTLLSIIRAYKNWPRWFLLFFNVLRGDEHIIKARSGERFIIRRKHGDIHRIGETYHLDTYSRILIHKEDIVIDIGAHCGFFSVYAAKRARRVYSFEPVEESFKALKKNMEINNITNIVAVNKGISSKGGKAKIYISQDASCNSMMRKTDRYEIINLTTLKEVFDRYDIKKCDYFKIDCEGAEFSIIMECPKKYLNRIKNIAMEYHDGPEFRGGNPRQLKKLVIFLRKNGFIVKIEPNKGIGLGMLYAFNACASRN